MKRILVLICLFLGSLSALPQNNKATQSPANNKQILQRPNYNNAIKLLNNSTEQLTFQIRYNFTGATWATYEIGPGEEKTLLANSGNLIIFIQNSGQRSLTYALQPGRTYQIYWSVPRSLYDLSIVQQ